MCCKYFKEDWDKVKPGWNDGWILDLVRVAFWGFSKLSISRIIVFCKEKKYVRGHRKIYQCVDWYVLTWVLVLITFTAFVNLLNIRSPVTCIILGFVSYRLFDIWQSWISQFMLGGVPGQWNPRNIYRSLVLVFVGYGEIIFLFALLYFLLNNYFEGIVYWQQAFYYSVRNAITIGSSDVNPIGYIGFTIYSTQIMFVLLFLTAVIGRIMGRTERRR